MGDEKDITMLQPETTIKEEEEDMSPRPDISDVESIQTATGEMTTTDDGMSPRSPNADTHWELTVKQPDPLTDTAVLAELKYADRQARRTANFIQAMRQSISHYTQKEDMTQEELEALENEQNELMKKLQEFEEITKRVQKLVGLSDTSSQSELWETLMDGDQKTLEMMGKGDPEDAERAENLKYLLDNTKAPKMFFSGIQDDISKLVMCESLKNEKPSPQKDKPFLQHQHSCPDLMVTLTGRLNESYSMQEKLATENANLEGLRYSLQEELLHKDNAVDFLQRQVGSLQAEMKIIVKENALLNEKLLKLSQEKQSVSGEETLPAKTTDVESQLTQIEMEVEVLQNELGEVYGERSEVKRQLLLLQELQDACVNPEQASASNKLTELKQLYDTLRDDYQHKITEISTLHSEVEKQKQLSETARENAEKMEQKVFEQEEKTKLQELEIQKLLDVKEQMTEQELQLNSTKQKLREAQDELEELRATSQEQVYQLGDYRNKYLQAQQQVEEQRRQIEVMEMDNIRIGEQINTEIQRIKSQFQGKLQELAPLPEILKATQLKLQESQQGRLLAEHNLEETARELEDAKDQIATVQKQMEEECSSLHISNEEMQSRITMLEKKCTDFKDENSRLKALLTCNEENAALSVKRLDEKSHELAQLTTHLETVKEESAHQLARMKDRTDSMRHTFQNHVSELERQLAQSRAAVTAAQQERDEVRQRMQSQINALSENFHDAQMRILSLQSHITFLKTSYTNMFGDQLTLGDVDLGIAMYVSLKPSAVNMKHVTVCTAPEYNPPCVNILGCKLSQIELEVQQMKQALGQVHWERMQLEHQRRTFESVCDLKSKSSQELKVQELQEKYNRLEQDHKSKVLEVCALRCELEKQRQIAETAVQAQHEREWNVEKEHKSTHKLLDTNEQELQLNLAKQKFCEAQDELEELRMISEDQVYQLNDYRNKYLQAQQQVEEQRRQIEAIEIENTRIGQHINKEIQRAKMQFQEKLQELAPLPTLLKANQLKLQESQQGRLLAEHNLQKIAQELETAREQITVLECRLEAQNSSQQVGTDEVTQLTQQVHSLENKCNEFKEENSKLKASLSNCRQAIAQSEKKLEEKVHEVIQLAAQLETVREESARQVTRAKDRAENIRHTLQSQITELERQLAQSRALGNAVQKDRDEVELNMIQLAHLSQAGTIRQCMQLQINNLNENFDQAQMRIRTLQSHVNILKRSYSSVFGENDLFKLI